MPTATEGELLAVLARGAGLAPTARAALLARAGGGADVERLPLGERDLLILRLRETLLGRAIVAQDACPDCGDMMEFSLDTDALARTAQGEPDIVRLDGFEVRVRALTGADVVAAEASADPRAALLDSAVVGAVQDGDSVPPDALPARVQKAVEARAAATDPLAEISLDLTCAQCGAQWRSLLDPGEFVWQELQEWGRELLSTVHVLARSYGWTESDVLALPPARRRAYVKLALDG
ncbi:hypothetical protein ABZ477_17330 [Microbacterium sp. NPDC019599]|uniref:T4 family baseplate hub assembly chaperone n=1 Tax=Microbacterium sp. NPDC019599 TaxID=3154690 RepID=UPI0033F41C5C